MDSLFAISKPNDFTANISGELEILKSLSTPKRLMNKENLGSPSIVSPFNNISIETNSPTCSPTKPTMKTPKKSNRSSLAYRKQILKNSPRSPLKRVRSPAQSRSPQRKQEISAQLKLEIANKSEQIASLQVKINSLDKEMDAVKSENKAAKTTVTQLEEQKKQLQLDLQQSKLDQEKLTKISNDLKIKLHDEKMENENLQAKIRDLQQQFEQEKLLHEKLMSEQQAKYKNSESELQQQFVQKQNEYNQSLINNELKFTQLLKEKENESVQMKEQFEQQLTTIMNDLEVAKQQKEKFAQQMRQAKASNKAIQSSMCDKLNNMKKDLFYSSALAIKLDFAAKNLFCNFAINEWFDEACEEDVPVADWHRWIATKANELIEQENDESDDDYEDYDMSLTN